MEGLVPSFLRASRPTSREPSSGGLDPLLALPARKGGEPGCAWEEDYQPWRLLLRAMLTIGKQAAFLIFVYVQLCVWNPTHHRVLQTCRQEWMGPWAYPCEASKACARAFPLVAASIGMVAAGRFILQSRLFYSLLMRKVLLDFSHYRYKQDTLVVILACCFVSSLLHFAFDLCFPPFVTVDRLADIGTIYIAPCCVFFMLYESISDIERHFVPLTKFFEGNPGWAKLHLGKSEIYLEESVKCKSLPAQAALRLKRNRKGYSIDELLDAVIKDSEAYAGDNAQHGKDPGRTSKSLFRGLWPARLLLDPKLSDVDSLIFRRSWIVFGVIFIVVQVAVVTSLVVSAWQESVDAKPGHYPVGAVQVDTAHYEYVGEGYCRGSGMRIPDHYSAARSTLAVATPPRPGPSPTARSRPLQVRRARAKQQPGAITVKPAVLGFSALEVFSSAPLDAIGAKLNNLEKQSGDPHKQFLATSKLQCARHCAAETKCIAYAIDPDTCTIYVKESSSAPPGWTDAAEDAMYERGFIIQQTNGARDAECWAKVNDAGEPQDYLGVVIYLFMALLVLGTSITAAFKTKTHQLKLF